MLKGNEMTVLRGIRQRNCLACLMGIMLLGIETFAMSAQDVVGLVQRVRGVQATEQLTRSDVRKWIAAADTPEALADVETTYFVTCMVIIGNMSNAGYSRDVVLKRTKELASLVGDVKAAIGQLTGSDKCRYEARKAENDQAAQQASRQLEAMNRLMMANVQQQMAALNSCGSANVSTPKPRSSSLSTKRVCPVHGVEYDIRFPTRCPACSQPDFGSGKTPTCPRHGCFLQNGICPQCRLF